MQKTIHSRQNLLVRKAIKRMREEADLSQRDLGGLLDKSHSFISKCELGERRVDMVEFYHICKACKADPEKEAQAIMKALRVKKP